MTARFPEGTIFFFGKCVLVTDYTYLFQETVSAHGITIISEMATGVEEEFHKYYNEMVCGQTAVITT